MADKSYYQQLKEDFKILEFVKGFQNDFTYYDRDELRAAKNFLLAARETGTNFVNLDHLSNRCLDQRSLDLVKSCEAKEDEQYTFFFSQYNTRFFYGTNGIVKEITREQALDIFEKYLETANKSEKKSNPQRLLPRVAYKIEAAIQNVSNRWGGDMYEIFNFGGEDTRESITWKAKRDKLVRDVTDIYLKRKFGKTSRSLFTIDEQKEIYNNVGKNNEITEAFGPVLDKIRENREAYWKPAIEKANRIKPLAERPGYSTKRPGH